MAEVDKKINNCVMANRGSILAQCVVTSPGTKVPGFAGALVLS